MIFAVLGGEKTKPIQSQTKPILVSPQIFWGLKGCELKKQSQFRNDLMRRTVEIPQFIVYR